MPAIALAVFVLLAAICLEPIFASISLVNHHMGVAVFLLSIPMVGWWIVWSAMQPKDKKEEKKD